MNGTKYLQLDYRLIKGTAKYFLLFPAVFIFLLFRESSVFAVGYLYFILVFIAQTPFDAEVNKKGQTLFVILPAKVKDMVLGRYLYLSSILGLVWVLAAGAVLYLKGNGLITPPETLIVIFTGAVASIICFIQYPLFYKFGLEKAKIVLFTMPAMITFMLPMLTERMLTDGGAVLLSKYLTDNKVVFATLVIVVVLLSGILSYHLSCKVCKEREI
ncbi:ABC-2 transporter permease [Proteinivorax tanatarense]|uniref:ABC-2 transporter permease n=1 Tax=Proteinivorax tanatarense TaxID=1260629 RepID=A0AAU7VKN3_9FIRM